VSVAGAIAGDEIWYFDENELPSFFSLLDSAELIVGHNLFGFDYKVLQQYADFDVAARYKDKTFDILRILARKTDRNISLNDLALRNLGMEKSGKGIDAPELFKTGRIDELKAYLAQDLRLTQSMFAHITEHKTLKYGHINYKEPVERTVPIDIDER
jgi:DEAD/DEAH box helicase domain-containing protein